MKNSLPVFLWGIVCSLAVLVAFMFATPSTIDPTIPTATQNPDSVLTPMASTVTPGTDGDGQVATAVSPKYTVVIGDIEELNSLAHNAYASRPFNFFSIVQYTGRGTYTFCDSAYFKYDMDDPSLSLPERWQKNTIFLHPQGIVCVTAIAQGMIYPGLVNLQMKVEDAGSGSEVKSINGTMVTQKKIKIIFSGTPGLIGPEILPNSEGVTRFYVTYKITEFGFLEWEIKLYDQKWSREGNLIVANNYPGIVPLTEADIVQNINSALAGTKIDLVTPIDPVTNQLKMDHLDYLTQKTEEEAQLSFNKYIKELFCPAMETAIKIQNPGLPADVNALADCQVEVVLNWPKGQRGSWYYADSLSNGLPTLVVANLDIFKDNLYGVVSNQVIPEKINSHSWLSIWPDNWEVQYFSP